MCRNTTLLSRKRQETSLLRTTSELTFQRMQRPIVIAHHLIWTAYGWWLPNDPRGSTSHTIASDVLAEPGRGTC